MSIIISKDGSKAVKVDKSPIEKENYLQEYIYQNPESIPLYDIKEDIRLLILAREFSTNSGPIDAIGIDQYGELYIVETKLYKNPDKRTVIAQALDYGAALWKHANDFNAFLSVLDEHARKVFGVTASEKIRDYFELSEEDTENTLSKMQSNLNDGVFHFVVLMDELEERLKDLIIYVNQNSQFDVYAVELEYYTHDTYEIIIPKIFGTEVKKDIAVSVSPSKRRSWSTEDMLAQARELLPAEQHKAFSTLYTYASEHADSVRLGSGKVASFNPIWNAVCGKSLFSAFTNGKLQVNYHWLIHEDESNREAAERFMEKMRGVGFTIPEHYEATVTAYGPSEWVPRVDALVAVLAEV
jgi:hypothetical protein